MLIYFHLIVFVFVCAFRICLGINNSCIMIVCHPTLFCLTYSDWAFLAVPGLGGGGGGGGGAPFLRN